MGKKVNDAEESCTLVFAEARFSGLHFCNKYLCTTTDNNKPNQYELGSYGCKGIIIATNAPNALVSTPPLVSKCIMKNILEIEPYLVGT